MTSRAMAQMLDIDSTGGLHLLRVDKAITIESRSTSSSEGRTNRKRSPRAAEPRHVETRADATRLVRVSIDRISVLEVLFARWDDATRSRATKPGDRLANAAGPDCFAA